jgi:hypothetical protein
MSNFQIPTAQTSSTLLPGMTPCILRCWRRWPRKRSSIGLAIAFRAPRANCGRWGYSEATELAHYIMDHRAYHSDFVEACQHRKSYP